MATRRTAKKIPRVGARVKLMYGMNEFTATVIEDRGNLAVGGGRLLRVRLDMPDVTSPIELEVPAEKLTAVAA